ncbi:MAG TPA: hypothetical protein VE398_08390 [Acidobacteriota bacterium]|nr:hypothetical protein [Acidobacteriota bacterium]
MCWYSQSERLSSRRAVEGEELVVREIPNQPVRWLVSPQDPQVVVCLPDRCNLRLNDLPEDLQAERRIGSEAVAEVREVYEKPQRTLLARIFLDPLYCRDALVFPNGRFLAVSRLPLDMRVDVLSAAVAFPFSKKEETKEPASALEHVSAPS